jgi:hypothetical protein
MKVSAAFFAMVALTAVRPAVAAPRPHVAYLGSIVSGVDAETREALDGGVVTGIQGTAAIYVGLPDGAAETTTNGQPCATPACLARLKAASGAEYFVVANARGADGSFSIEAQIVRAQPYEVVSTARFECSGCIPLRVRERMQTNVGLAVGKLIDALDNRPTIQGPPAATPIGSAPAQPPPPARDYRRPVAVALLVIAGASLAAGGAFWYLDGRKIDCETFSDGSACTRHRTSMAEALVATGVGVALGVTGGVLLYRSRSGGSAKIDVGLGTVVLNGRF